jgi:integrase
VCGVRADSGDTPAHDIAGRFGRWVYPEKLAEIELPKLTRKHVDAWRQKLAKAPVVNPHADAAAMGERFCGGRLRRQAGIAASSYRPRRPSSSRTAPRTSYRRPTLRAGERQGLEQGCVERADQTAAKAAGLVDTVTAYSMRHSAITDLITGGLAILTAAQLSGRSVAMIEKHYGHLRADDAASALASLAL